MPAASTPVAEEGILHLDAGTPYSTENQEKMTAAIRKMTASESSGLDRLQGLGTLLSQGEEPEPDEDSAVFNLIGLAATLAIFGPPCYMAARVLLA